MRDVVDFIDANRGRYVGELRDFLAIPSVSALPAHADDMHRAAAWASAALGRAGLEHVRVIDTAGHPLVYADWLHAPDAPTVLVYGHYDVQPVDPLDAWTSPPFDATVRDGRLYARGATDDKGQLFIHVKAVEAYLACGKALPVNVKVILEGEEEIGCAQLLQFVRANAALLAADVIVNSDNAMIARGVPSLTYGMRGIACFQLDVRGCATDLHSGTFGGAVANPAFALVHLLAQLEDPRGRVTIPGFYDDVVAAGADERAHLATLPFDEEAYRERLGAPRLFGEEGYSTLARLWTRPTLEINGIAGGFTGSGFKTVIPAIASAKLSMRLVPNQDPARVGDLLAAHLARITPDTVRATLTPLHAGEPWSTPVDGPFMQAAARAMTRSFGVQPVFIREGGSNPIVPVFEATLGAPVLMFGIGVPDENAHAPNEYLDLEHFQRGIVAAAWLYAEIGAGSARESRGM